MTAPIAGAVEKAAVAKAASKAAKQAPVTTPNKRNAPDVRKTSMQKVNAAKVAKRGKQKFMPALRPAKVTVRYRQMIAAEIIIGSIVILTQDTSDDPASSFSKTLEQEAAFLLAFFFLAVLTGAGPSASRFSATLGGVLLLALLLKQKGNVFTRFMPKAPTDSGSIPADGGVVNA